MAVEIKQHQQAYQQLRRSKGKQTSRKHGGGAEVDTTISESALVPERRTRHNYLSIRLQDNPQSQSNWMNRHSREKTRGRHHAPHLRAVSLVTKELMSSQKMHKLHMWRRSNSGHRTADLVLASSICCADVSSLRSLAKTCSAHQAELSGDNKMRHSNDDGDDDDDDDDDEPIDEDFRCNRERETPSWSVTVHFSM